MSDWISVKDRLPDECAEVLVHEEGGAILTANCWCSFGRTNWHRSAEGDHYSRDDFFGDPPLTITHWMPLPEPPVNNSKPTD